MSEIVTNEGLIKWAEDTKIWGETHPLVKFSEWLISGGPDRWHAAVLGWNWDSGLTPLYWIVEQPLCDAATALTIFYNCEPSYDYSPGHEEYELLKTFRRKWSANEFPRREISFTLPPYVASSGNSIPLNLVPESMRVSLFGRQIEAPEGRGYGIPAFMYSADAPS